LLYIPDLQQAVGETLWEHKILIMQRTKDEPARRY
jgi:hypothetical protein